MTKLKFSDLYTIQPEAQTFSVPQEFEAIFDFNYGDGKQELLQLYEKGKRMQWNAKDRIDWSLELDDHNPLGIPSNLFPLIGLDLYDKLPEKEKGALHLHYQAWNNSQFMHGEQGALICAAKTVQQVPGMEAKFYASTQVIDEARHVEAYNMLLEKFGVVYPMALPLKELLDQVLRDSRWDMTYLGMQVVIEGLALAAFATIRDQAQNQLAQQVNAYVMQDEARHVAFGRLALRDYYPNLTDKERDEREEFLVEACYLMRDRFLATEVWENLGLPTKACLKHVEESQGMQLFRNFLFSRIVPVVKDIGLWGPRIQKAYADMGVLQFADINIDQLQDADEEIAKQHDARRAHIQEIANLAVPKSQ